MPYLRPLPPAPMPEYANYQARVRKWSTVQVAGRTYSVPSRLIGKEVRELAEPKVPEAPALTLSGQPDLKVYDRLLTGSLATAGVCG